jgi:Ca-activated chloride channel family protein
MIRIVIGLSLIGFAGAAAGAQQVFRGRLDTVPVYATVTDRAGRLVTDLVQDDFQILDNGRPQPITLFDNSPQPIKLIVMLDVSGSMSGNARLVQLACDQLFAALRPDDQVKVGTFGNEITISPVFTSDVATMRAAVPTSIPANAPTPLYRALDEALSAFGDGPGRRVVLVLSDGKNQPLFGFGQKFITVLEVIDRAQREDVMVYAIGLQSRGRGVSMGGGLSDPPDPELPRLAADTGGGYFEIRPRDDLGAAFAKVADELHRQYLIGFTAPAADGRLHRIEVKLRPKDMQLRARKNYQAPRAGSRFEVPR